MRNKQLYDWCRIFQGQFWLLWEAVKFIRYLVTTHTYTNVKIVCARFEWELQQHFCSLFAVNYNIQRFRDPQQFMPFGGLFASCENGNHDKLILFILWYNQLIKWYISFRGIRSYANLLLGKCCDEVTVKTVGESARIHWDSIGTYKFLKRDKNGLDIWSKPKDSQRRLSKDKFFFRNAMGQWAVSTTLYSNDHLLFILRNIL